MVGAAAQRSLDPEVTFSNMKLVAISEILQPVNRHGVIIIDRGKSPELGLVDVWERRRRKV
jgi:hypothetical protein